MELRIEPQTILDFHLPGIDIAFETLPLNRIQARHLAGNLASLRVTEKPGMTREATIRHITLVRGQPVDIVMYSILREEWEANRA